MNELEYMPQNSRFEAILLGFLGGALDVYCQIQFDTLVATQTGNILFLIADISHSPLQRTLIRFACACQCQNSLLESLCSATVVDCHNDFTTIAIYSFTLGCLAGTSN